MSLTGVRQTEIQSVMLFGKKKTTVAFQPIVLKSTAVTMGCKSQASPFPPMLLSCDLQSEASLVMLPSRHTISWPSCASAVLEELLFGWLQGSPAVHLIYERRIFF